jgi:hypothetical protein
MTDAFIGSLIASGPHPSLGAHAETYGRVIGSWIGEIENHMLPGSVAEGSIEAHFAWVLEGRAVQDVWITPARGERFAPPGAKLNWCGSTLRVFEPAREAWRAVWTDPVSQRRIELLGKRQGDDIVQLGARDGRPIRWTFSRIEPASFSWQGHILNPDGQSWQLEVDIRFRRAS